MNLCECGKAFPEECARDCIVSENQNLRTQLTACQERLARAEGLIRYAYNTLLIVAAMHHRPPDEHLDEMKAFLTTSTPSDMVAVKREDINKLHLLAMLEVEYYEESPLANTIELALYGEKP